ncbi:MAG: DNA polymerase III subunit delta [Bacteriovoracia bacterium]
MPKLEPKVIQKELESGQFWPVYWLYGPERMKSGELLKRIRKSVYPDETDGRQSLSVDLIDGAETDGGSIVDSANTLTLGGSTRLIIVRDAQAIDEPEALGSLLGPRAPLDQLPSICVFLANNLDMRTKFSKVLLEKAAVVSCEEVADADREAWVQYLMKRRNLQLAPAVAGELVARLRALDPWSLELIDQELEKASLWLMNEAGDGDAEQVGAALQQNLKAESGDAEHFLAYFFSRQYEGAMKAIQNFANQPEESLPLLGLLAWNVRQLALLVEDRRRGTRNAKLNPYVADRFNAWVRHWPIEDVLELQTRLADLDFSFKQTPRLPLGLWGDLVVRFCHAPRG